MNILYIEDDLVDQMAFKRLAGKFDNLTFQIASSVGDAVQCVSASQFDVIISDYYLGRDTIFDVLEHIKNLPVYLLSGSDVPYKYGELLEKGVLDYTTKPISKERFTALLSKHIYTQIEQNSSVNISPNDCQLSPDFSGIENLAKDSTKLKIELMEIFLTVAGDESVKIQKNLENKDWGAISVSFHKLKSNLRMMGFSPLLEKANEFETNCRYINQVERMPQEIPVFLNSLKKGMKIIENNLSELKESSI